MPNGSHDPVYINFRTPDYEECYQNLYRSMYDLGLEGSLHSVAIEPRSWRMAQAFKPSFVLHSLKEFEPHPVVWLDADCMVRRQPSLFHEGALDDYDFAAHLHRGHELLTGTLWVNNTPLARQVCVHWERRSKNNVNEWEQRHLQQEIREHQKLAAHRILFDLPAAYCKIFDIMKTVENPVIEHYQQSRIKRRREP